jgi:hypothetical protein
VLSRNPLYSDSNRGPVSSRILHAANGVVVTDVLTFDVSVDCVHTVNHIFKAVYGRGMMFGAPTRGCRRSKH